MSWSEPGSQASQQPSAEFSWRNRGHSNDVGVRAFRRSLTFNDTPYCSSSCARTRSRSPCCAAVVRPQPVRCCIATGAHPATRRIFPRRGRAPRSSTASSRSTRPCFECSLVSAEPRGRHHCLSSGAGGRDVTTARRRAQRLSHGACRYHRMCALLDAGLSDCAWAALRKASELRSGVVVVEKVGGLKGQSLPYMYRPRCLKMRQKPNVRNTSHEKHTWR